MFEAHMPTWTYPQLWQIVSGRLLDSEVFYILFSETRHGYREGGIIVKKIAARLTILIFIVMVY